MPLIFGFGMSIYIKQLNKELPKTKKEHVVACLQTIKKLIVLALTRPQGSFKLYPKFTAVVWSAFIVNSVVIGKVLINEII